MLFGHTDKLEIFERLVAGEALGHAYLFYGDVAIGKAHFAKLLAYRLEYGNFEIMTEPLIDTAWFEPDEKGTIGIGKIRDIKNFLWQTPLRSKKRLVVVDNAETLTDDAQGALLKIVEEPPAHGTIIFIAHDAQVLVGPLLSRLSKIYFSRLARREIEKVLVGHFKLTAARAKTVALKSFGRIGRAIGIINGKIEEVPSFERDIEEKIIELWTGDKIRNAKKLAWLIDRESSVKKFNLNQNLQRKAVEYKISHD